MKTFYVLSALIILSTMQMASCDIYSSYYPQAQQIVNAMTLQQKIGQMSQPDIGSFTSNNKTDFSFILKNNLGSVLVGGNGAPTDDGNLQTGDLDYNYATLENWKLLADNLLAQKIEVPLGNSTAYISLLLGTDAVHGNQHVVGEVLFPQNIGLAATGDPQNFYVQGQITADHALASGWNYIFAPTVAVSHNPQWGRFYETLGQDPELIYQYAQAFVEGAQQIQNNTVRGAMTSTKHYLGDGATYNGHDEGDDRVYNFTSFYSHNIAGYQGGISASTGTIMCSYSAINNIAMAINGASLLGKLKDEEGFSGFIISDYDERPKVAYQGLPTSTIKMSINQSTCTIINAGIDMMMSNGDTENYHQDLLDCINQDDVSMDRIDDAVKRILAVKLAMNLVEIVPNGSAPQNNLKTQAPQVDNDSAAAAALKSAQESLVLLKNKDDILPLDTSKIENIILVGFRIIQEIQDGVVVNEFFVEDTNNIGAQNGGWTVRWQGYEGNQFWEGQNKYTSHATSIQDALISRFGAKKVLSPNITNPNNLVDTNFEISSFINALTENNNLTSSNTIIIGVLTESPYAEFMGDVNSIYCRNVTVWVEGCLYNSHTDPYMPLQQRSTLNLTYDEYTNTLLKNLNDIPLITVLLTGRPMIINQEIERADALIAAWLPGTVGGEAIVQSILGEYRFGANGYSNKLPIDWVQDMADIQGFPVYNSNGDVPSLPNPLFKRGYGIYTADVNNSKSSKASSE